MQDSRFAAELMNKHLLTAFLLLCSILPCQAQDFIVKKTGETIPVKILEVTQPDVTYQKYGKLHGHIHIMPQSRVLYIRYENGTVDNLDNKYRTAPSDTVVGDAYQAGVKDAQKYYRDYKTSGSGTLIVGLLSPVAGLAPAIACASTPPKNRNLAYPNPDFMQNPAYAEGYRYQAKHTKQNKVWTNWGIGLGVNVALALLLLIKHTPNL